MFIISKIVGFLLDPFIWIMILVVISVLIRDHFWRRISRRTAIVLFLFFSNSYIINNIWEAYQYKPVTLPRGQRYEAGIVLGGMAGYDERIRKGFFGQASDRFIQAARLYHNGSVGKLMVTGGNAIFVKESGYNEADFIGNNLRELDIPAEDIFLEKRSRNTRENASFSKAILDSAGLRGPYVLITSAIHMPRAKKIFEKRNIPVVPYPCNYKVLPVDTDFTWRSIIPTQEAFNLWALILKEWAGLVVS